MRDRRVRVLAGSAALVAAAILALVLAGRNPAPPAPVGASRPSPSAAPPPVPPRQARASVDLPAAGAAEQRRQHDLAEAQRASARRVGEAFASFRQRLLDQAESARAATRDGLADRARRWGVTAGATDAEIQALATRAAAARAALDAEVDALARAGDLPRAALDTRVAAMAKRLVEEERSLADALPADLRAAWSGSELEQSIHLSLYDALERARALAGPPHPAPPGEAPAAR